MDTERPNDNLVVREVAAILKLSADRVRQLANDGKLPHKRVGNMRVFVRKDVLAYRDSKR